MIDRGNVEDGVFTTIMRLAQLAGWVLRQEGRARPLARPSWWTSSARESTR